MIQKEQPEHFSMPLAPSIALGEIAVAHPDVIRDLRELDPLETAAMFSSLLTIPGLQSNCIRIEALVHMALAYGEGRATPTNEFVEQSFKCLGDGQCGMMEDPSEDEFVTLASTPSGNFRIFEGIWQGASFHLERILDVVESMPDQEPFTCLRNSIQALLTLSDAVAERAGLREHILGQGVPLAALPPHVIRNMSIARGFIEFTDDELAQIGIARASLSEFIFDPIHRSELQSQFVGHTGLERRPIMTKEGKVYLLLPSVVGPAIVRFVIEFVLSMGLARTFERALAESYARLFYETRILCKRLPDSFEFQRIESGRIANAMIEIDPGRFLHLFFFVDGTDEFLTEGLNGTNAKPTVLSSALDSSLQQASAMAGKSPGFLGGITMLVTCGYGRAVTATLARELPTNWRLESLAAYDLTTLNWLPDFDALALWRLLDSRDAVEAQGPKFLNVNGLLNLVAWSRQLGGHLVPHGSLPQEFADPDAGGLIVIPQDALRGLRHGVALAWASRRVLNPEGRWAKVRKLDRSEFEEDNAAPLYGSEEDVHAGKLRAVYVAPRRSWWIEIAAPDDAPRDQIYQHWMMLCIWLRRAAPVLDRAYLELPTAPVSITVRFAEIVGVTHELLSPADAAKVRSLFRISAETGLSNLAIEISQGFADGFAQPENIAEKAIVEALVSGVAKMAGESEDISKQEQLMTEICPNSEARWIHRFQAHFFRDRVRSELGDTTPVLIATEDDARSRIGLGWKARSRKVGSELTGVSECTSYLNEVVRIVLDDLSKSLHSLDRRLFADQLLRNHESAVHDRDVWKRTAQSNLALHDDKKAAVDTIVEHNARLNACFVASRIVLEAAICECPLVGGRTPGTLDLSRALAQAMRLYYLGGWSDAIHWGAMEPRLRITPLGDIHANHDFIDNIYQAFGRVIGEQDVKHAVDSYAKIYEAATVLPTVAGLLENEFLDAWEAEYGASLDGMRAFLDKLEDLCGKPPGVLIEVPRSLLNSTLADAARIPVEKARAAVETLTLVPRPAWRTVGEPFSNKDWFPWRFRRRLSVLRRPFIQVNEGDDPPILVTPGLVRDALFVMARSFHEGGIPPFQARSLEMVRWIGHANRVQRTEFNLSVADRMRELGWEVKSEVRLTKLLGRSLDRDYGDIDVLAWKPASGQVFVMECKSLQFHKTLGEVAEQLSDFRGETGSDGKPDHLMRHLERLRVLDSHAPQISNSLRLQAPIQMTGHLVFKNPVPMQFAWDKMASKIRLSLFDELDKL
jgi:hypothetical protein